MSKPTKGSSFFVPKIVETDLELSDLLEFSKEQANILDNLLYNLCKLDSLVKKDFNPVPILSSKKFSSEYGDSFDGLALNKKSNIFHTLLSKRQTNAILNEIKYLELERIIDATHLFYNNLNLLNPIQRLFLAQKLKHLMLDVLQ